MLNDTTALLIGDVIEGCTIGAALGLFIIIIMLLVSLFREPDSKGDAWASPIILGCAIVFLVFIDGYFFFSYNVVTIFIGLYPTTILAATLATIFFFRLYLALGSSNVFLPHTYRGVTVIVGSVLCIIAFHIPWFVWKYNPPASFPSVFNHTHVPAFTTQIYFDKLQSEPIDFTLIGVKLAYNTIEGLVLLLILGVLLIWVNSVQALGASRFLFLIELLFLWGVFCIYSMTGLLAFQDQQTFIADLGGGTTAVQAGRYFTEQASIGFYLFLIGLIILMIALFLPEKITSNPRSNLRNLLISVGSLALYLVLTHLTQWNAFVTSGLHGNVVERAIASQILSVQNIGFWPLVGYLVGSVLVVVRQRQEG